MRNLFHLSLWICVVMAVCLLSPPSTLTAADRDPFRIDYHESGSSIYYLSETGAALCLTDNMPGWHLGPQLIQGETGAWVVWEINRQEQAGIGIYDLARHQAREHMLEGISDIGQLEARIDGEFLSDLFFIAKGNQVDVYHYRADTLRLKNLTNDKAVEHRISMDGDGDLLDLELERIDSFRRLRFDRRLQKVTDRGKILWQKRAKKDRSVRVKAGAASTLDDYFVAFGDSITWGKMYLPEMGDTKGEQHVDLAYPNQLNELLTNEGYSLEHFVSAVPSEKTFAGRERIDALLESDSFSTLVLMEGTNDMIDNTILYEISLENIAYIVDSALQKGMRVLLCTIPPRNDAEIWVVTAYQKTLDYNSGLRQLAQLKKVDLIEVYNAFWNHSDGYQNLLEVRDDFISSGCHPNPDGHALIASLMKDKYDLFLLKPPQAVASSPISGLNGLKVVWQAPNTHNIDHYVFEFGTQADDFSNVIELEGLEVQFILLQRYFSASPISDLFRIVQTAGRAPQVLFQRGATVYYRIKTVNTKGLESRYSPVGSIVLN